MGGDKKATTMVLKVDLKCSKCYRKIKRVLCQIPQIHDQVFDEKANTVTIKVVCCSPDCVKRKIISKAGATLKGINIKVDHVEVLPDPTNERPTNWIIGRGPPPPLPLEPVMPVTDRTKTDSGSPPESVKSKDGRDPPPPPPPEPVMPVNGGTEKGNDSPSTLKPKYGMVDGRGPAPPPPEEPQKPKADVLVAAVAMPYVQGGGYHHHCSERYYQYDGYCARPVYDSYGGGMSCQADDNSGACAIM